MARENTTLYSSYLLWSVSDRVLNHYSSNAFFLKRKEVGMFIGLWNTSRSRQWGSYQDMNATWIGSASQYLPELWWFLVQCGVLCLLEAIMLFASNMVLFSILVCIFWYVLAQTVCVCIIIKKEPCYWGEN